MEAIINKITTNPPTAPPPIATPLIFVFGDAILALGVVGGVVGDIVEGS